LEIYEAIYSRRTVRDFKEKEIDLEIIKKIIDAGLQAPTNNHMRQWEFIIINDKTSRLRVIDKISKNTTKEDSVKIVDEWGLTDHLQRETYIDAIPKQYQMLLTAGCLIIPCFKQKLPLLKPKNLSALNYFASIWCCIENILLAAASEGIFGVTRIPFDEEIEQIREVLDIPEDYQFPCYLALGYPSEDVKPLLQHSIKVDDRMHFNKW
jgi:nitroreductase